MSVEEFEASWETVAKQAKQDADYEAEKLRTNVIYKAFFDQARDVADKLMNEGQYLPDPHAVYRQGGEIVRPSMAALISVTVLCKHLSEYAQEVQKQFDVLAAMEVERKLRDEKP